MLPAIPNRLVQAWFNVYCRYALRKFFHRVHLFGNAPFDSSRSTIYLVNHCSFWDVIVVNFLIKHFRPQTAYCMSDLVQVKRHPFFRRVGAFSVDRTSPRDGMRALRYAADLLNRSPCAVVLFPQGGIEPVDVQPLHFERGIERLMKLAPSAQVILVAIRYEFWENQRAEVLLDLSLPMDRSIKAMEIELAQKITALAEKGRTFTAGDLILLRGRRSISDLTATRAGGDISDLTALPPVDPEARSYRK